MTTEYRNQCENTTLNVNVKRKFDKAEQNIHSLVLRWWFWFRLMTSRLLRFVSYYLFYIFYISLGSLLNTFAVNVSCAKLVTSFQADRSIEDACRFLPPPTKMWVVMSSVVCVCVCVSVHNGGPHTGPWTRPYLTDLLKLVYYEARTIRKWVVGMRLECLRVLCLSWLFRL